MENTNYVNEITIFELKHINKKQKKLVPDSFYKIHAWLKTINNSHCRKKEVFPLRRISSVNAKSNLPKTVDLVTFIQEAAETLFFGQCHLYNMRLRKATKTLYFM